MSVTIRLSQDACDRFVFFFFKRKTAYDMRISDWRSDVCSSDLGAYLADAGTPPRAAPPKAIIVPHAGYVDSGAVAARAYAALGEIGRASCRERVCQYVYNPVAAVELKKKQSHTCRTST